MFHVKKPTPAPIFNHRKRPRQAVFADPLNDVMPGPSGAASAPPPPRAQFSDLMPPQGFGQGRNPTPQQRPQAQARGGSTMHKGAAPMRYRNTQASPANSNGRGRFQSKLPYEQQRSFTDSDGYTITENGSSSTPSTGYRGRGNGNTSNFNPRPQTTSGFQANRQQSYPVSFASNQSMGGARNPGIGPYGDMGQQRGPTANYGSQNQQKSRGSGRVGFSRNYSMPERGHRDDKQPNFSANMTFGGGDGLNDNMNDTFNVAGQNKQSASKGAEVKKPPKDFEKSLHTITSTIAGMRRWNKFRDSIQLLFEIYGYVDSAITKQGHDCKEFLLRDDRKDAVKCLFYEVDRQLPKLTRGQRIRCVGNLDTKNDIFKVMSIRPSQEAEREMYKTLIGRSDQLMHRMTKNLREI